MLLCNRPYPCVVESKTIKRQLKVEIFVQLWIRCVNAALQVATILRSTFIEIPVQEVFPELKQSCRCYCVCSAIIMMCRRFAWLYTIIWICKKTKRERKMTLWIEWWIICIDFARWVFFYLFNFECRFSPMSCPMVFYRPQATTLYIQFYMPAKVFLVPIPFMWSMLCFNVLFNQCHHFLHACISFRYNSLTPNG